MEGSSFSTRLLPVIGNRPIVAPLGSSIRTRGDDIAIAVLCCTATARKLRVLARRPDAIVSPHAIETKRIYWQLPGSLWSFSGTSILFASCARQAGAGPGRVPPGDAPSRSRAVRGACYRLLGGRHAEQVSPVPLRTLYGREFRDWRTRRLTFRPCQTPQAALRLTR